MRSRRSWAALFAAALVLAVDVLYLLAINNEDEGQLSSSRVQFVAGSLAAAAVCCVVGAVIPRGTLKLALLAGAGFLLLLFAFLAMFSIGLLLVIPTILALRAASKAAQSVPGARPYAVTVATGAAAFVIVALGLANTA